MHLPSPTSVPAPRDGRVVEFRLVFLQRPQRAVKRGLTWASAQIDPPTVVSKAIYGDLLPFRVAAGDLLDEIDDAAP
jgi:hypothetical protein